MTLFAIMRSPLIWGGKLVDSNADELKLMQNSEVLAVNQHSTNNKPVVTGKTPVWVADVPESPIKYVAVFNRNESSADVTINFSSLGVTADDDTLRDLWEKEDIGVFSASYKVTLAPHQSRLYRLTPPGATMVRRFPVSRFTGGNSKFVARVAGDRLFVESSDKLKGFSVSVFMPDGRRVKKKNGCTGAEGIRIVGKGVFLVKVTYNGGSEKCRVACY